MNDCKFAYLKEKKGDTLTGRVLTIAYRTYGPFQSPPTNISFGVALSSSRDKFVKKIGRNISVGRMAKGHKFTTDLVGKPIVAAVKFLSEHSENPRIRKICREHLADSTWNLSE